MKWCPIHGRILYNGKWIQVNRPDLFQELMEYATYDGMENQHIQCDWCRIENLAYGPTYRPQN
jgi:hypothetical protein